MNVTISVRVRYTHDPDEASRRFGWVSFEGADARRALTVEMLGLPADIEAAVLRDWPRACEAVRAHFEAGNTFEVGDA